MLNKICFSSVLFLFSMQSAYAYQCEVSCQATYRENLGWFTGTGRSCSEADQAALAQCRAKDPGFFPMEGGCTEAPGNAAYTRRCETNYVTKTSWQTVYGESTQDIYQKARVLCNSFCQNYKYYSGNPSACGTSSNACKP